MPHWFNKIGPDIHYSTRPMSSNNCQNFYFKLPMNTSNCEEDYQSTGGHDIVKVALSSTKYLLKDDYGKNRLTGSLVLVDDSTN